MKELIANFTKQLQEAIQIGEQANLAPASKVDNVLISGLGGSGIGGTIVSQLTEDEANVPICVNKDYTLPSFVNEKSLVIISSYSGNTEETLSCLEQAIEKKAKVVCVTSGGKVAETAKAKNLDLILIPGGMPPRACLGYSLTQLFFVLNHYNVIGDSFKAQIKAAAQLLDKDEESILQQASEITGELKEKLPVIYTTSSYEGIAIRFRQQLNENAKMLCWHHVFPELNHNELVGWRDKHDNIAVVLFRNEDDFSRNQTRIEISKDVFKKYTSNIIEVFSKGNSPLEKALYLIHLGDWVSFFLSEKRGFDANEIEVINHLKSELAKI